jgi:NADH-quinone oxidoreductase subunit J
MESAATVGASDLSTSGQVLFLVAAVFALVSAVGTVSQRSPLRAALSLLVHIMSLAGLYLSLHAHLLAAVQMLVYAGAVVVLFVFVIMLIGPGALSSKADERGVIWKLVGVSVLTMFTGAIVAVLGGTESARVTIASCAEGAAGCVEYGSVDAISNAIFVDAAVPFELVSILLLVAIIVAIAVARGIHPGEEGGVETDAATKRDRKLPIRPRVVDSTPEAGASDPSPAE